MNVRNIFDDIFQNINSLNHTLTGLDQDISNLGNDLGSIKDVGKIIGNLNIIGSMTNCNANNDSIISGFINSIPELINVLNSKIRNIDSDVTNIIRTINTYNTNIDSIFNNIVRSVNIYNENVNNAFNLIDRTVGSHDTNVQGILSHTVSSINNYSEGINKDFINVSNSINSQSVQISSAFKEITDLIGSYNGNIESVFNDLFKSLNSSLTNVDSSIKIIVNQTTENNLEIDQLKILFNNFNNITNEIPLINNGILNIHSSITNISTELPQLGNRIIDINALLQEVNATVVHTIHAINPCSIITRTVDSVCAVVDDLSQSILDNIRINNQIKKIGCNTMSVPFMIYGAVHAIDGIKKVVDLCKIIYQKVKKKDVEDQQDQKVKSLWKQSMKTLKSLASSFVYLGLGGVLIYVGSLEEKEVIPPSPCEGLLENLEEICKT